MNTNLGTVRKCLRMLTSLEVILQKSYKAFLGNLKILEELEATPHVHGGWCPQCGSQANSRAGLTLEP